MKLRSPEILNHLSKHVFEEAFVLDSFDKTIPFVFADCRNNYTKGDVLDNANAFCEEFSYQCENSIAPPFPVTSYEFETSYFNDGRIVLHCVEIAPDNFIFTELVDYDLGSSTVRAISSYSEKMNIVGYVKCKKLMRYFLALINDKKHGIVNQKRSYKFNKGKGDKRSFKQSKFVYINSSKSEQKERINGKKIVYSNGFYVSAHWRKLRNPDSIGLNRQGERCVKGLTWVGHYYKGDDPIIKTRKIS